MPVEPGCQFSTPEPHLRTTSPEIVAFVRLQLGGPSTGSSWQACNHSNRVRALH